MNETTVSFWQTMMVLRILLAARIVRLEAGMKVICMQLWFLLTGEDVSEGYRKDRSCKSRPVRGGKL